MNGQGGSNQTNFPEYANGGESSQAIFPNYTPITPLFPAYSIPTFNSVPPPMIAPAQMAQHRRSIKENTSSSHPRPIQQNRQISQRFVPREVDTF
jgi:hypothetical protein